MKINTEESGYDLLYNSNQLVEYCHWFLDAIWCLDQPLDIIFCQISTAKCFRRGKPLEPLSLLVDSHG